MSRWTVPAVALVAALCRVPFVRLPLSPDEGGMLMVAGQWAPGRSLYGDYWVDRPPLLVLLFDLAGRLGHVLGDPIALRLLGTVAVLVSVLLAGRIGALASGPGTRRAVLAAVLAAALLVSPSFGSLPEVNAELLAVPFVLAGVVALLSASRTAGSRIPWLLAAGAAGAAAALVKQNEVDVLVLAVPAILAWVPRTRRTDLGRHLASFAVGVLLTTVPVLAIAAVRGTGLGGLWDALVTFRIDAAEVIGSSAAATNDARLSHLVGLLLLSGIPLLVAGLVLLGLRSRTAAWPALVLLGWELVSVAAGGSYWLHYLVCLVPGVVLLVAVVTVRSHAATVWSRALVAYGGAVALVSLGLLAAHPPSAPPGSAWLRAHARPGDTAVVAFGGANILQAAGLTSPYENLWSLPVRVRDPSLTDLTAVLDHRHRPTFVLTKADLAGWGITPVDGQVALAEHYREVAVVDGIDVYRARRPGHP